MTTAAASTAEELQRPSNGDIYILGSKVSALTTESLHRGIASIVDEHRRELVLNVNIYGLNLAYEQSWLREFRNQAPIVYCDGAGVVLGARLLGHRLPGRMTMADTIWPLATFCEQRDYSLFFLGGKPGRAEISAERLKARHPKLRIVGTHHGYFEKEGEECDRVIKMINDAKPNLLIVGFGMPLQEKWLLQNYSRIQANALFAQGAIFDFVSGSVRRCPAWMGAAGLEWLFRLGLEPSRMFSRYLLGNPLFLWRVVKERVRNVCPRRPAGHGGNNNNDTRKPLTLS